MKGPKWITLLTHRILVSSRSIKTYTYGGKLVRNPSVLSIHDQSKVKLLKITHALVVNKPHEVNILEQVKSVWRHKTFKKTISSVLNKYYPRMATLADSENNIGRSDVQTTAAMDDSPVGLTPPGAAKGMTILNRDIFKKTVNVPGLLVPVANIAKLSKAFKDFFLKVPGIKPLASLEESHTLYATHKLFLFDPVKLSGPDTLSDNLREKVDSCGVDMESFKLYDLDLDYRNWSYQEILKSILPDSSDGVAGFSTIGHIIHLNLREDVMDYKHIIGEVLLEKVSSARTVVNKLNMIDNTFRNFAMEVLAGEDDMVTTTREHGLSFKMDFSKVYWNPRLGTEHRRVVNTLHKGDVVYDVFAGIGPFAVPAARKGCIVLANDLNPHSYKWLNENLALNKVKKDYHTYNQDGREFIKSVLRDDMLSRWAADHSPRDPPAFHIVMNLPALAVEFLDAFCGLFHGEQRGESWKSFSRPVVHCYAFSKADDTEADISAQVHQILGFPMGDNDEVRFVRNVAPNKDMMCAVFELRDEVLFGKESSNTVGDLEDYIEKSPPSKKSKLDSDADI